MRLNRFLPAAALGHIAWSRYDGAPYAIWRLPTTTGDWLNTEDRVKAIESEAAAYDLLPPEWAILSIERAQSAAEVGAALSHHALDYPGASDRLPTYATEVRAWMQAINEAAEEGRPPAKRETYLVLKLPGQTAFLPNLKAALSRTAAAIFDRTEPLPSLEQQRQAIVTAALYEDYLADLGPLQRLTPGQLRHFVARLRQRGVGEDPYDAPQWESHKPDRIDNLSWGEFDVEPVRPVGGREVVVTSERYEMVPTELDNGEVEERPALVTVQSFQTTLVVTNLPESWVRPGMELTRRCDSVPFPVDIAYIGRTRTNEQALRSLKHRIPRTRHEVSADLDEFIPNERIAAAERAIRAQHARHTTEKGPDHLVAILLTIGADDIATLRANAALLTKALGPRVIGTTRPTDDQPMLYTAFLPAAPQYRGLDAYRRYLHSPELASLAPRYSVDAGTPYGMIEGELVLRAPEGPPRLVLDAPDYGLRREEGDMSASCAVLADSGGGKTYKAKRRVLHVLATGGQVFLVDVTQDREWARAARVFPPETSTQIVRPLNGSHVLDPLRVFTRGLDRLAWDATKTIETAKATLEGDDLAAAVEAAEAHYAEQRAHLLSVAESITVDYYSTKCGLGGVQDDLYTVLQSTVAELLASADPSMYDSRRLLALLEARSEGTTDAADRPIPEHRRVAYQRLYDRIDAMSRAGGTRESIFGSGPVLDLTADCVIFETPGLALPSAEAVRNNAEKPRETDALALMYLMTAIMVHFATQDRDRFTQVVLDECHALSENPHGRRLIENALRQLRRAVAGLWLGTQISTDLTDEEMDDLIPHRWAGRANTDAAARRHLAFLGAAITPDNIAVLRAENCPSGTFLRRDPFGRIALVRNYLAEPQQHAAFETSRATHESAEPAPTSTAPAV